MEPSSIWDFIIKVLTKLCKLAFWQFLYIRCYGAHMYDCRLWISLFTSSAWPSGLLGQEARNTKNCTWLIKAEGTVIFLV